MLEPTETGSFPSADGLPLYFELFRPEGSPRAAIVLAHGYTDHTQRSQWLTQRLVGEGYVVFGFDFRGHGRSGGRRGHCDRFTDYVEDLRTAIEQLRLKLADDSPIIAMPDLPIVMVSESHGSLVTLRLLIEQGLAPINLRAAVLCSPYLGLRMPVSPLKTALARAASRIAPLLSLKNGMTGAILSHDAESAISYDTDPLVHRVATARWFVESSAAQTRVADHADGISIPTLWLAAGDDLVASTPTTQRVFERAGGDKKLLVYSGFYHELWSEPDRERVFADMAAWIAETTHAASLDCSG